MPDLRRHRGPHPQDERLFDRSQWSHLQLATSHLSWLLSRGYVVASSLKLVGDRFQLDARQRLAVRRSSCSDRARELRARRQMSAETLVGQTLDIDGFNLLTTIEAALAGGVLLRGRDGCLRDMASMHGSYRKVEETLPALQIIGQVLESLGTARCLWWLDRPVSNSGRVSRIIMNLATQHNWPWQTRLVVDPDPVLQSTTNVVVSSDSVVLDHCACWANLAAEVVARISSPAWVVPLDA